MNNLTCDAFYKEKNKWQEQSIKQLNQGDSIFQQKWTDFEHLELHNAFIR